MTDTKTTTLSGNAVPEHDCTETGIDCYTCLKADQDAAAASLEAWRRERKARVVNPRKRKSAVEDARPVATINVSHVTGDIPMAYNELLEREHNRDNSHLPLAVEPSSELQMPLSAEGENFVAAPAHLGSVTVAKGFILAGHAIFTARSKKTGTRYTYKVTRGRCSRCGKTDCQCWAHPLYFVSLLTGPDNTGDYTYLGMIRDNRFQASRATGAQESGRPFAAFRWVWERLAQGRYPDGVEIWHEGRCGKCGRPLTVPESIANGIGPVCAAGGGM